jgi:hypothetical protein
VKAKVASFMGFPDAEIANRKVAAPLSSSGLQRAKLRPTQIRKQEASRSGSDGMPSAAALFEFRVPGFEFRVRSCLASGGRISSLQR